MPEKGYDYRPRFVLCDVCIQLHASIPCGVARRTQVDHRTLILSLDSQNRLLPLPFPCSNEVYEERLCTAIGAAQADGIEGIAFGDLFLTDVRQYRERSSGW